MVETSVDLSTQLYMGVAKVVAENEEIVKSNRKMVQALSMPIALVNKDSFQTKIANKIDGDLQEYIHIVDTRYGEKPICDSYGRVTYYYAKLGDKTIPVYQPGTIMFECAVNKGELAINSHGSQQNGAILGNGCALFLAKFTANLIKQYDAKTASFGLNANQIDNDCLKQTLTQELRASCFEDYSQHGRLLALKNALASLTQEQRLNEEQLACIYSKDIAVVRSQSIFQEESLINMIKAVPDVDEIEKVIFGREQQQKFSDNKMFRHGTTEISVELSSIGDSLLKKDGLIDADKQDFFRELLKKTFDNAKAMPNAEEMRNAIEQGFAEICNEEPNELSEGHDSIHEDAEVAPKFYPLANGNKGVLLRKLTLNIDQIQKASWDEPTSSHRALLDCILCKNVMIEPKECSKCRKGFCKTCIDEYVSQLVAGDFAVCCPSCSTADFEMVDPHPLLQKQLKKIRANCANADKGCTEVVSYINLKRHLVECSYAMIKCSNFGCEVAGMFQKDFPEHEASCEFRESRCDQCKVIIKSGDKHDCVISMSKKYEIMEGKLSYLSRKLDLEIERNARRALATDKGTQMMRLDIGLPALSQVKFNSQLGWQQQISENIMGLPEHTRMIILKFGLTDINIRREFINLTIHQEGSSSIIDLTNYFMCGPEVLPPFGQTTEILMQWDEKLESKLVIDFQVAPQQQPPTPPPQPPMMFGHPGNPYNPIQYYQQQMLQPQPPKHHIPGSNPYAYATFSIGGFQFKQ